MTVSTVTSPKEFKQWRQEKKKKDGETMQLIKLYIVNVTRKSASRWYTRGDLPKPQYWKYSDSTCIKVSPRYEMFAHPGDVLELVEVARGSTFSYHGMPLDTAEFHVFRRVQVSKGWKRYRETHKEREIFTASGSRRTHGNPVVRRRGAFDSHDSVR